MEGRRCGWRDGVRVARIAGVLRAYATDRMRRGNMRMSAGRAYMPGLGPLGDGLPGRMPLVNAGRLGPVRWSVHAEGERAGDAPHGNTQRADHDHLRRPSAS